VAKSATSKTKTVGGAKASPAKPTEAPAASKASKPAGAAKAEGAAKPVGAAMPAGAAKPAGAMKPVKVAKPVKAFKPKPLTPAQKLALAPHQVVLRPLVTEKGMHRSTRLNQYAFEVSPLADKELIKQSVEILFNVTVLQVRTQNRKGKPRRHRFRSGRTKDWKKAIVTLDKEHRIDFF
jgi:large subunit ribosomal protein L23